MKAIVVTPGRPGAQIKEVKDEGKGKVRLRILENGICGTDREIVSGKILTLTPPPGKKELILGHEALAVVEEDYEGLKKGDIVMPVNRRPCTKGDLNCLIGRPDYCETGEFLEAGIKGMDGFMREYWYDDPRYLVKVPPAIRDIAIMAQPLSDIEKSVEDILFVQRRLVWTCEDGTYSCRKAAVLGTGPIGILFSLLLKTYGFDVWAVNRREPKERESTIFEAADINFYNSSKGMSGLGKVDLFIDATGSSVDIIKEGLSSLKNDGVLGLFGFPRAGQLTLDFEEVQRFQHAANLAIGLVNGQKPHFQRALVHLAAWKSMWPAVTKNLITKEIRIDEEREVLDALNQKIPGEIKVKITWV
jgi:aldose 1-dehydrogenase [NAD(P)+]